MLNFCRSVYIRSGLLVYNVIFIGGPNRLGAGLTWAETHVLMKGKQFLLHVCHPCPWPYYYSCYKSGDKPWIRKGPDCDYNKRNIPVLICDTVIPYRLTKSLWWPYNFRDDFYLATGYTKQRWSVKSATRTRTRTGNWRKCPEQKIFYCWYLLLILPCLLLSYFAVLWRPFWKWRPVEIFQCRESIRDIIIYPHIKFWWYRTMLNFSGIVAAILKMATGRNFSM